MKIKPILKRIGRTARRKESTILLFASITGLGVSIVTAIDRTPIAESILSDMNNEFDDDLTKQEVAEIKIRYAGKLVKNYIPTLISASLTIATMVLSHNKAKHKEALLTGALNMAQNALFDYRHITKEAIKEKEYQLIEERFADKRYEQMQEHKYYQLSNKHHGSEDDILDTGHGTQLFYDTLTGHKYRACVDWIKNCCIDLNRTIMDENEADYAYLYGHITDKNPQAKIFEDYIWTTDDILYHKIEPNIVWTSYTDPVTGNTEPMGNIEFYPEPHMI